MINIIVCALFVLDFQTISIAGKKNPLFSEDMRINWKSINSSGVLLSHDNNYLLSGSISQNPGGIIQCPNISSILGGIISGFWSSECNIFFYIPYLPQKDFFALSSKNLVFKLYQNFPNPFRKITKIRYDIPKACKVNISIYDICGRQIKQLVNEEKDIGKYEILWDRKDENLKECADGIYFIHMKTKNFEEIKKMIIVK